MDDILIRIRIVNRGSGKADLTFLPTLWFRNTWCWSNQPGEAKPRLCKFGDNQILAEHNLLGQYYLTLDGTPEMLFTENETNTERLWGWRGDNTFYKDAFHEYLIHGKRQAVNPKPLGTKACAVYRLSIEGQNQAILHFRLARDGSADLPTTKWDAIFDARIAECMDFYGNFGRRLKRRSAPCAKTGICRHVLE